MTKAATPEFRLHGVPMKLLTRTSFCAAFASAALLFGCSNQTISTSNSAPQATITSPAADAQLEDTTVIFAGTVRDSEDSADVLEVRWYDNANPETPMCDGFADSTGYTTCPAQNLTAGSHLITLQVTDSKGASDDASIEIVVLVELDPPTVVITSPLSGFTYYESDVVEFAGHVASADGSELSLDVIWNSDIQGDLFAGTADSAGDTTFQVPLNDGTHIITLRAIDSVGAEGSASTAITVSPYPPGQLDLDLDGFCPDGIDQNSDGHCIDDEITGINTQDCDDFAAGTYPGATEVCDGEDNDCDGTVPQDEIDADNDGQATCEGDCDDANQNNYQNNTEICDGADNDCNTLADMDAAGEVDVDGDTYLSCNDCNDNDYDVNPSVAEVCGDGIDNDCDGLSDSGLDLDGDGSPGLPCGDDCDDANPIINPAAYDDCSDLLDNDCDGVINSDEDDLYESNESSLSSAGYELSGQGPDVGLAFGVAPSSGCWVGVGSAIYFEFEPGQGSVSGNFSHSADLDIYEIPTSGLNSVGAGYLNVLFGEPIPSGCDQGSIAWSSPNPINVILEIDGTQVASSAGTASGSESFTLDWLQITSVDYRIIVQQTGSWLPTVDGSCGPNYTVDFYIP
jgi:hypothetical protein